MYLYQFSGDHSFTVQSVVRDYRGFSGLHFLGVRYEENHPFSDCGYRYQDQIFIAEEKNSGLWNKTNLLFSKKYPELEKLSNKRIRIKVEGLNYFFFIGEDEELIGIIHNGEDWDDVLIKHWNENDGQGYSDEEQAIFFGTSVEEINKQFSLIKKQRQLARSKTSVFPLRLNDNNDNIISYGAAISSPFNGDQQNSDGQNYYGIEILCNNGESKYIQYKDTLFPLIKNKEVEDLYQLLNEDIITIERDSRYSFIDQTFFKSIIKNGNVAASDIYIWIKLENLGEGKFDSYYYAASNNREVLKNIVIPKEPDFLRQIIYLSSLSTQLSIKEIDEKNKNQRKQALKTAIGSIMSRNMSHNLGSHFLYYTKKDLEEDQKSYYALSQELNNAIKIDKLLFEISNSCGAGCLELTRVKESIKSIIKPSDEESKKYAGYILKIYYTRLAIDLINNKKREGEENIESIITSVFDKFQKYKFPTIFQDEIGLTDIYKHGLLPFSYLSAYEEQKDNNKEYWKALGGASHVIDFCKNRMNYIAAVVEDTKYPSMPVAFSSIIKELILDDEQYNKQVFNNYYLGNIVRSEGYTRKQYNIHRKFDSISFRVIPEDNNNNINDILLSLPGGALSIHAFYNIIENFIRNSAKYQAFKKKDKLVFSLRYKIQGDWVWFKLSDNKDDADTTFSQIIDNISRLRFLNNDGTINQSSKGLKEMILSYLWMICWSYPNISIGDVLFRWDTLNHNEYNKSFLLNNFLREIVNCNERAEFNFGRVDEKGNVINTEGSLCLHFSLPLHKQFIKINTNNTNTIDSIENTIKNTDLIVLQDFHLDVKNSFIFNHFPRVASMQNRGDFRPTKYLEDSINIRLGTNIKDYSLKYGEFSDPTPHQIIYEGHQNIKGFTQNEINENWEREYFDSISGGNYTGTIKDTIQTDERIRFLAKESALTRITIIDERIFDGIKWIDKDAYFEESVKKPFIGTQVEQSLKNVRILNYFEEGIKDSNIKEVKGFEILKGNEFRKVGPLCNFENATHFLTIHLGLIEKMLKNSTFLEEDSFCGKRDNNSISPERVNRLMSKMKSIFFIEDTVPFICIHSGRGGLSSELKQTELKNYPFIPYITLESLFNDSKFLLSSMFYSRIYSNTR